MSRPNVSKVEFDDMPASPVDTAELEESQADTIRRLRSALAAKKAVIGAAGPMKITSHLDAERMLRLGLLTPEQIVDLEDRGLLPPDVLRAAGIVPTGDEIA
jgi:hypothetical protein